MQDQNLEKQAADYLPKEFLGKIPTLYSQDGNADPIAWVKLFLPEGRWTYFVTEYSEVAPDGTPDLMFGYLLSMLGDDCDEWCYMELDQVAEIRSLTLGLPVERDLWFNPKPLSEALGSKAETPVVEEEKEIAVKEFPTGWTVQDVKYLIDKIEAKPEAIFLVADNRLGIPTIHELPVDSVSCGVGFFRNADCEGSILVGTGMEHTPSGNGWTDVTLRRGTFAWDREAVLARLHQWAEGIFTKELTGEAVEAFLAEVQAIVPDEEAHFSFRVEKPAPEPAPAPAPIAETPPAPQADDVAVRYKAGDWDLWVPSGIKGIKRFTATVDDVALLRFGHAHVCRLKFSFAADGLKLIERKLKALGAAI